MKLLLQNIKIFDKNSEHHLSVKDIRIHNGIIKSIGKLKAADDEKVFNQKGAAVSPGWLDLNCHIFEPGFEYREDIESGLNAAAKGGFTKVCYMPNTFPVIDTRAQIEFLINNSKSFLTEILPIGAVSKNTDGKDLADIYEMNEAGAYAYSDGIHTIQHSGLMERALLYVKRFEGLIMNFPHDNEVARDGQMNEGIVSTKLGLHAAPKLAEELMVARDIYLLEHTASRLHFNALSTAQSVDLVKAAKAKKLKLTSSVNVANLLFDDSSLEDFDSNFKVLPHLRNNEDIKALKKGLKNGAIDAIASGHLPLHQDDKKVEFDNAYFGISTLEIAFSMARTATKNDLEETILIEKLSVNPYQILGLEVPKIEEGSKASISVFNLDEKFTPEAFISKGKNNPLLGKELLGKVYGIIQNNKTNIL